MSVMLIDLPSANVGLRLFAFPEAVLSHSVSVFSQSKLNLFSEMICVFCAQCQVVSRKCANTFPISRSKWRISRSQSLSVSRSVE